MSPPPHEFEWKPEHDALLQKIASTDDVEGSDWNDLRQALKHKLQQNVSLFQSTTSGPPPPPPFDPIPSTKGGLRLPPFSPQRLAQLYLFDPPVSYMDEEQIDEARVAIFDQLDQFEEKPPFTIQRLCELLIEPKAHYKTIGKYLRAVEKSILVTSTQDAFPVPPESSQPTTTMVTFPTTPMRTNGNGNSSNVQTMFPGPRGSTSVPSSPLAFATRRSSTPSTPLFSPIPFLHADARSRSKSRSPPPQTPPMTPLSLAGHDDLDLPVVGDDDRAIGLVDELDDPSPGHLSEKPTPLTVAGGGKPFTDSTLQSRFVKSEISEGGGFQEGGVVVKVEGQEPATQEDGRGFQWKKVKVEDKPDSVVPKEAKVEEKEAPEDVKMELDNEGEKASS